MKIKTLIYIFLILTFLYLRFSNASDFCQISETFSCPLDNCPSESLACFVDRTNIDCTKDEVGQCSTCNDDACLACQRSGTFRANQGCFTCNRCLERKLTSCNKTCDENKIIRCQLPPPCVPCQRSCIIACNKPRSIFIPRSQGANTARELVGWEEYIYRFAPGNFFTMAQTLSYTHSFRPERISQYLFGSCSLKFAGSQIADRNACELLADNFGLSPNFRGSVRFNPKIENIIFDNQLFFGLNCIRPGFYARFHLPIVHTRWNLCPSQVEQTTQECTDFPACYMSKDSAPATCNIFQALSGNFTFGDMRQPWEFGRFSPCVQTKTRLADIDVILGWNPWQDELFHFGFYSQLVVPTGNKPNGRLIFEPIVGNAKHWEFGGGVSSHVVLWSKGPFQSLSMYLEGNVTHMFKNTQCRSFDFCQNGSLSRYMLLKEFEQKGNQFVYTGNIINGINFTTRPAEVTVAVKGDASAKLAFRSPCWAVDVGYNFYGKTREKVCLKKDCSDDSKFYAIKGTSDVCALVYNVSTTVPKEFESLAGKIDLQTTQSDATICSKGPTDNAENIPVGPNQIAVTSFSKQTGPIESKQVKIAVNSSQPEFVCLNDLDIESGSAGAVATHKVFGLISYTFNQFKYCSPFIGFGGEFEVEGLACNEQTSLNQWGVWLKGGLTF